MKLTAIAERVIELSRAIQAYWAVELPRRHPNYPVVDLSKDDGPPPPEEGELSSLLSSLPPEQVYALTLLMYLGRRDFTSAKLEERFAEVKQRFPDPAWAVSQMLGKAPLPDYLSDGLERLKKDGIDLDAVHFENASLR